MHYLGKKQSTQKWKFCHDFPTLILWESF